MQVPTSQTPVMRAIALGQALVIALAMRSETADIAVAFQLALTALVTANGATAAAEAAVLRPRIALRFAERNLDMVIRRLSIAATALDGGKRGRATDELFPEGLAAAVRPRSEPQYAIATKLMDRLIASAHAAALRTEHQPALRAAMDAHRQALDARQTAQRGYETALAREMVARDAFVRAYDVVASQVRAIFPKDREMQDLFFDTVRAKASDGEPETTTVAPTAPTATTATTAPAPAE